MVKPGETHDVPSESDGTSFEPSRASASENVSSFSAPKNDFFAPRSAIHKSPAAVTAATVPAASAASARTVGAAPAPANPGGASRGTGSSPSGRTSRAFESEIANVPQRRATPSPPPATISVRPANAGGVTASARTGSPAPGAFSPLTHTSASPCQTRTRPSAWPVTSRPATPPPGPGANAPHNASGSAFGFEAFTFPPPHVFATYPRLDVDAPPGSATARAMARARAAAAAAAAAPPCGRAPVAVVSFAASRARGVDCERLVRI